MQRSSWFYVAAAWALAGCGGHDAPASDAQVVTAEARAEQGDVVEECLEEVNDRYESALSDCDDAACEANVEQEKVSWYAACR